MATETLTTGITGPDDARPYTPSWLNRLTDSIDGLPVPRWVSYGVLAIAGIIATSVQGWSTGELPLGAVDPRLAYYGALPVALLWLAGHLARVAGSALDVSRSLLALSDSELKRLRYDLTVAPARQSLVVTGIAIALTLASYGADPIAAGVAGLAPVVLVLRALIETANAAVTLVIIYQLLRQTRQVGRIVALMTRIDLFQPRALYAFSKLTSRTGVALVVLISSSLIVSPPPPNQTSAYLLLWAPWLIGIPLFAAAAFILPLRAMHERLVTEKERLRGDAEERLQRVLGEINRDVDGLDLSRADGLGKTLASLIQQRDVLAKLPTWPWSVGTFRGFLSALLLPLAVFLMQRFVVQLL